MENASLLVLRERRREDPLSHRGRLRGNDLRPMLLQGVSHCREGAPRFGTQAHLVLGRLGAIARLARTGRALFAALLVLTPGCASPRRSADWLIVREVTPPYLLHQRAADPALTADRHGRVALTFVTRDSIGKDLWLSLSRDSGTTFSSPVRLNARHGSVNSYSEARPIAAFGPSGELAVAWGERRSDTSRAVDLVVRASGDGGVTLGPPVVVNNDLKAVPIARRHWNWYRGRRLNPHAYHGFPALTFLSSDSLFAAWLDERDVPDMEGEPSTSALYGALSSNGGQSWGANQMLADSVCPCCRPMALSDPSGKIAVAYRRGARDLRDPALLVSFDGGRSFALDTLIFTDRWLLRACPDQGPVLSWNREGGGYYAWYTGAGEPGVYLMPWRADHGGAGVRQPLRDSLSDAHSPRLASLEHTTLIAVEARPSFDSTRTVLAVRAFTDDGSLTPWNFLGANIEAGWVTGLDGRTALASWVEREGDRKRVRLVKLRRRVP